MTSNVRPPIERIKGNEIENPVLVNLGGQFYDGWKTASIKRSIENLTSSFTLEFFDIWRQRQEDWPIIPGLPLSIFAKGGVINDGLTLTGFINKLSPSFAPGSRALTASGRGALQDLVDCSVHGIPNEYKNISLVEFAEKITSQFPNINVIDRALKNSKIPKVTIEQGDTYFTALEKVARKKGVVLTESPAGNLILETRGKDRATTELHLGVNCISGQAEFDDTNTFSDYIVKGQSQGSDNFFAEKASQPCAIAKDSSVTRFRPKLIIGEKSMNDQEAQDRANWEATFAAANAGVVSIRTYEWLQQDNRLWQINEIVKLKNPFVGIADEDLLIKSTNFTYSKSGGKVTDLELVRKDSYDPQPEVNADGDLKNGLGWG